MDRFARQLGTENLPELQEALRFAGDADKAEATVKLKQATGFFPLAPRLRGPTMSGVLVRLGRGLRKSRNNLAKNGGFQTQAHVVGKQTSDAEWVPSFTRVEMRISCSNGLPNCGNCSKWREALTQKTSTQHPATM